MEGKQPWHIGGTFAQPLNNKLCCVLFYNTLRKNSHKWLVKVIHASELNSMQSFDPEPPLHLYHDSQTDLKSNELL